MPAVLDPPAPPPAAPAVVSLPMLERWVPQGPSPSRIALTPPARRPAPPPEPVAPKEGIRTTLLFSGEQPHSPWSTPAWQGKIGEAADRAAPLGLERPAPTAGDGMDGVRRLILGRQFSEMQTKVTELQMSLNGEMKRIRDMVLQRVDEMAALMHRDMVVLRQEMAGEIDQLKKDIFTAATDLSMAKDRLSQIETRTEEHSSTSAQNLDARLNQQSHALADALGGLEDRMETLVSSEIGKVAKTAGEALPRHKMADLLQTAATRLESAQGHQIETGWPASLAAA